MLKLKEVKICGSLIKSINADKVKKALSITGLANGTIHKG